jgi:HEXXH motif-containing protein
MLTGDRRLDADRQRLLRFLLLQDELADQAAHWPAAEDLSRIFELAGASAAGDFVAAGTSFLWYDVARALSALRKGDETAAALVDFTLRCAVDSYAGWMPAGEEFAFPASDRTFVLPRNGVAVHCGAAPVTLRTGGPGNLEIECAGRQWSVEQIPAEARLDAMPIPGAPASQLLLTACPTLYDATFLDKVVSRPPGGTGAFAGLVGKALEMIEAVDAGLFARVNALVHWYVPIHTPGPSVHNSFTVKNLRGVIFLSESYDDVRIAEALVHEFHHNELYTVQESIDLHRATAGELFYSPWRPDPRPLDGLLHALYVFTGVAGFIRRGEALPALADVREQMRGRRAHVVSQLQVGLMQVPREVLTEDGASMIDSIAVEVEGHARELGLDGGLPDQTRHHLDTWRTENPGLAARIVLPEAAAGT